MLISASAMRHFWMHQWQSY